MKKKIKTLIKLCTIIALLALAAFPFSAHAKVRLPNFFNDHMVLQRDMEVPVWGWGTKGEKVTVEFGGQKATATVDEFGSWMVKLKPIKASAEGRTLTITSPTTNNQQPTTIQDVLVGEVWLSSGTDNMEWPMRKCPNARNEIKEANNPLIRFAKVNKDHSPLPENNVRADWKVCSSDSVSDFSATAYFFAKKLHKELGVPVGIISASWSKTGIGTWIPAEGYRDTLKHSLENIYGARPSTPEGKKAWEKYLKDLEEWLPKAKKAIANGQTPVDKPEPPSKLWITNIVTTRIFNGMINPLIPYAMRGVIWDEQESLARKPQRCVSSHQALINSWRKLWKQNFSFYFVQASGKGLDELREQQQKCLDIEKTGMAITTDISGPQGADKKLTGERLAQLALSKDYGK